MAAVSCKSVALAFSCHDAKEARRTWIGGVPRPRASLDARSIVLLASFSLPLSGGSLRMELNGPQDEVRDYDCSWLRGALQALTAGWNMTY